MTYDEAVETVREALGQAWPRAEGPDGRAQVRRAEDALDTITAEVERLRKDVAERYELALTNHREVALLRSDLAENRDLYDLWRVKANEYAARIATLEGALRGIAIAKRYGCCDPMYPNTPPCPHNIARAALTPDTPEDSE